MKKLVSLLLILMIMNGCSQQGCTVTFDCGQDGIFEVKTDSNSRVKVPTIPQREGYILKGWLLENGESFDTDSRVFKDVTLYPDYRRLYNVYFVSGVKKTETVKTEEGKIVKRPADPQRENYFFGGWYYHGREFDFTTPINAEITLNANWLKGYDIDYLDEDDNVLYHLYAKAGSPILEYDIPEKEGYKADGWYYNDSPYDFTYNITSDMTLKVHYRKLHTVTYVCDDIYSYTVSVADEDKTEIPVQPVKENYLFTGWYQGNSIYDFNSEVKSDIILTAHYVPLWKVVINCNNASDGNNAVYIVKDGDKINQLPPLSRTGYVFEGYYCNGEEYDFSSGIHSDTVISAHFRKIVYVTLQYDNATADLKVQLLEKDRMAKPDNPVKEGYQFMGWYLNEKEFDFETEITSNITLTAHWQENQQ